MIARNVIKRSLERLQSLCRYLMHLFVKATPREKALVFLLLCTALFVLITSIVGTVSDAFAKQEKKLKHVETLRKALPYRLSEYIHLDARKKEIESEYKDLKGMDDMRAEFEKLLKKHSSVQQDRLKIEAKDAKKFADKYKQEPFKINFTISDYSTLVEILETLDNGEKPIIIKSLDIAKNPYGNSLNIELNLIVLRRVEGE